MKSRRGVTEQKIDNAMEKGEGEAGALHTKSKTKQQQQQKSNMAIYCILTSLKPAVKVTWTELRA